MIFRGVQDHLGPCQASFGCFLLPFGGSFGELRRLVRPFQHLYVSCTARILAFAEGWAADGGPWQLAGVDLIVFRM